MNSPEYTLADLRRQHAAWRTATHLSLTGHPDQAMHTLLGDTTRPSLDIYCDMVSMATLAASLVGQQLNRLLPPGLGRPVVDRRGDTPTEPTGAQAVAVAMAVNAANGHLFETVVQVNTWACFDPAGIDRLTDLLWCLLALHCEASS